MPKTKRADEARTGVGSGGLTHPLWAHMARVERSEVLREDCMEAQNWQMGGRGRGMQASAWTSRYTVPMDCPSTSSGWSDSPRWQKQEVYPSGGGVEHG